MTTTVMIVIKCTIANDIPHKVILNELIKLNSSSASIGLVSSLSGCLQK